MISRTASACVMTRVFGSLEAWSFVVGACIPGISHTKAGFPRYSRHKPKSFGAVLKISVTLKMTLRGAAGGFETEVTDVADAVLAFKGSSSTGGSGGGVTS